MVVSLQQKKHWRSGQVLLDTAEKIHVDEVTIAVIAKAPRITRIDAAGRTESSTGTGFRAFLLEEARQMAIYRSAWQKTRLDPMHCADFLDKIRAIEIQGLGERRAAIYCR